MRAIEIERAPQPLGQRQGRSPAENRGDLRRVSVEVANVDGLLLWWPRGAAESPRSGGLDHQLDEIAVGDWLHTADVEHLAVRGVIGAGAKERVDGIVHENEV